MKTASLKFQKIHGTDSALRSVFEPINARLWPFPRRTKKVFHESLEENELQSWEFQTARNHPISFRYYIQAKEKLASLTTITNFRLPDLAHAFSNTGDYA